MRAPALAIALALGCAGAGGVERLELAESPVALLQRSEEDSLRRLDALGDLEKRQAGGAREGIAVLENLDAMFGGAPALEQRLQGFQGQLVLLDPRSGETSRLVDAPPQARPAGWSPDRSRLLIAGGWRSRRQLFAWERTRERMEIVTSGPAHHVNGCYTAEDRLVAVRVERESLAGAPSRLVASGPGGGVLEPLGEEGLHFAVACSPARPQIAFVRVHPQDGRPHLLVQSIDPLEEPREVAIGGAPVFTPDGEWVVYVAKTTQGQRLFRVRTDGSGRTPLGRGVNDEGYPAVSPDGRHVAFVVTESTRRERVWVRRMDGSGDRPLLTSGDGSVPVW